MSLDTDLPLLPNPPSAYDTRYANDLNQALRRFFIGLLALGPLRATALNLDLTRLPTEAALAALASGDVYRDVAAGNVLKVKP